MAVVPDPPELVSTAVRLGCVADVAPVRAPLLGLGSAEGVLACVVAVGLLPFCSVASPTGVCGCDAGAVASSAGGIASGAAKASWTIRKASTIGLLEGRS
jgi:hypothetical protein